MIVSPSHRAHLQASMLEGASKVAQSPSLKTSSSSSSRACVNFFFSATHCCHCWKNTTITITESVPRDLWPLKHFIWVVKETEKAPYYRKWHWTLPMQMVGFLSMQERGETTHKLKVFSKLMFNALQHSSFLRQCHHGVCRPGIDCEHGHNACFTL